MKFNNCFAFKENNPPKKPSAYVHVYRAPGAHEHYLEDVDVCASFSLPVKTLHLDVLLEAGQPVEAVKDALENVESLMSFLWRLLRYKQHCKYFS